MSCTQIMFSNLILIENKNHNTPKLMVWNKRSTKGEVYCAKHIKKEEKSQINNLTSYLKELEKQLNSKSGDKG